MYVLGLASFARFMFEWIPMWIVAVYCSAFDANCWEDYLTSWLLAGWLACCTTHHRNRVPFKMIIDYIISDKTTHLLKVACIWIEYELKFRRVAIRFLNWFMFWHKTSAYSIEAKDKVSSIFVVKDFCFRSKFSTTDYLWRLMKLSSLKVFYGKFIEIEFLYFWKNFTLNSWF